ncbi:MAG: threonine--tRNA ligase [alpha proteobacterium HIMB59]|jgi:threonyl-tRNA synthetase|nr:MAG: threonine--tRNA ligase [alpha proteobacterium HIMB59]|tara:strand:+ start:1512 stop:3296 length:1785 start_codon:yes stop_codon:yes gene_type:complete
MSDIIAYKDQSNEYFDFEVDNSTPVKAKSDDALNIMRHDMAHVLAEAVTTIFPNAKPTIGPFIKNGFYYDFDMENTLSDSDLNNIESKITDILKEGRNFTKKTVSKDQALELFKDNEYKIELIKNLDNSSEINLYEQENFTDLCKGPHHKSTKEYDAHVKITSVSGAYWRGISTNKMLQRIYATAFYSEKDLNKYLKNLEEAKERNHRRIGTDMGLFLLTDLSAGNVFWKEKGLSLYQNIEKYIRSEQQKLNYKEVKTPELVSNELWIKSGHWDNFKENMFTSETDNKTFALKPMNCPCHIVLFNSQLITYKDLPLRYSEFGKCHRYEPSGALNGLFRVRGFTQDDAHIFCTEEQIYDVCNETTLLIERVYKKFGFEKIKYNISTRPKKSIGTQESWDNAESQLKKVLTDNGKDFNILDGEGAFYGPKIEFTLEDSLGREWQCGTIQIDFNLPERLGAKYKDKDDKNQTPIMIHRAVVGSLERFIAIILENTNGWLPLFITPVQLAILPVSEKFVEHCNKLNQQLLELGIRTTIDSSDNKLGYKIRNSISKKIPYSLVIGEKEIESGSYSIRSKKGDNISCSSIADLQDFFDNN